MCGGTGYLEAQGEKMRRYLLVSCEMQPQWMIVMKLAVCVLIEWRCSIILRPFLSAKFAPGLCSQRGEKQWWSVRGAEFGQRAAQRRAVPWHARTLDHSCCILYGASRGFSKSVEWSYYHGMALSPNTTHTKQIKQMSICLTELRIWELRSL